MFSLGNGEKQGFSIRKRDVNKNKDFSEGTDRYQKCCIYTSTSRMMP